MANRADVTARASPTEWVARMHRHGVRQEWVSAQEYREVRDCVPLRLFSPWEFETERSCAGWWGRDCPVAYLREKDSECLQNRGLIVQEVRPRNRDSARSSCALLKSSKCGPKKGEGALRSATVRDPQLLTPQIISHLSVLSHVSEPSTYRGYARL